MITLTWYKSFKLNIFTANINPTSHFIHFKILYTMYVIGRTEWSVYQDGIEYISFNTKKNDAEEFAKELAEAYPDSTITVEEIYVC